MDTFYDMTTLHEISLYPNFVIAFGWLLAGDHNFHKNHYNSQRHPEIVKTCNVILFKIMSFDSEATVTKNLVKFVKLW